MADYKFTPDIQKQILALLWKDDNRYAVYKDCIQPRYFTNAVLMDVCNIIFAYKEKYQKSPSLDVIVQEVETLMSGSKVKAKLSDDYETLLTDLVGYELENSEYLNDLVVEFGKKQALTEAVMEGADIIEKGGDYGKIKEEIENALLVGENLDDLGVDYWETCEERTKKYTENDVIQRITTGSACFDGVLNGGLGKSELGVIIAPPGRGKTTFLQNLAMAASEAGFNVAYYFFENNENQISRNFDIRVLERPFDYLKENHSKVLKSLLNHKKFKKPGKLIVKKYKVDEATTNTIRGHLKRLELIKEFVPDMILVDYGTLMKPTRMFKEKRDNYEQVFKDLRALCDDFDVALWTAAQTNRGGFGKKVVTSEDLAECFAIINIADVATCLCQTVREQADHIIRYYLAKIRDQADHYQLVGTDNRDIKKLTIDTVYEDNSLRDDDDEDCDESID